MALTTAERLKMKAKARGLKTAEEREKDGLVNNAMVKSYVLNDSKDRLVRSHPDYQLDYLAFLLMEQFPEQFRKFTEFVALHHGSDNDTVKVLDLLNRTPDDSVCNFLMTTTGYWVLRHKGEIVCVATMYSGFKLNYLTTMVDHRRKGHAEFLLNALREFYAPYSLLYGAVYDSVLPLFEKCGWKVCSEVANKDGSVMTCPDYARENYGRLNSKAFLSRLSDEAQSISLLSACQSSMELIKTF